MKKVGILSAMAFGAVAFLMAPMVSWAGGTVEGKVTFSGKPPAPDSAAGPDAAAAGGCTTALSADSCSTLAAMILLSWQLTVLSLILTVVAIQGITDEKFVAEFKGDEVQAELCEFKPYTTVVVADQKSFRVMNHDADPDDPKSVKGVLHNPHSFEQMGASSTTIFNIALPEKDKGLDKPIKLRKAAQGSVLRMQCDQHEFMQTWGLPITNPYYAIVGEDGKFEIKDVPAGKYKLVAWHPALNGKKVMEQEIEVKDGAQANAKFEFKP